MSKTTLNPASPRRIIKVASCQTCTGKATLTYHIGCEANNEIHFLIKRNTGGGLFSSEWVSLSAIKATMENAEKPITSFTLSKLFKGKSTNTPGFLMAALKNEGLVRNLEGKIRGYEQTDSEAFMAEMKALIASDIDLKPISNKLATPVIKSAVTIKVKKASPDNETLIASE